MSNAFSSTDFSQYKCVSVAVLARVAESSLDSIVITDTNLDEPGPIIVYVNPAFTRMTGYTFKEAVGRSPRCKRGWVSGPARAPLS